VNCVHSRAGLATLDLKAQTAVAVAGSKFTAALAGMSVTTFVGK